MAYKTFANGFPLPASDLNNFLMNQSVIVFADSAARTTAIPSPVTGMLTYLEDTNAYESWNGSAYVALVEDPDLTSLIPKSTVTTAQDLIVADGASSVTRLGVGTNDQILSVVAGEVAWADAGGGGVGGNYYNITAAGTYTVDLAAGLYSVASTGEVTVGGVSVDENLALVNYASDITSIVTTSTDGTTWTTRTSGFGTTSIRGVTYGDGLYVAVGDDGTLTTSTDGTTWTTRTSGFGTTSIRGVGYGDGLYVAVGASGKLTNSTDGTTWTTRTSGFGSTAIYGVTYGDGVYVAVGLSGTLTNSTDGTTWTSRTSGFGTNIIRGVGYGDGLYVAVGDDGKLTTSEFEALYLSLEIKSPVTTLS